MNLSPVNPQTEIIFISTSVYITFSTMPRSEVTSVQITKQTHKADQERGQQVSTSKKIEIRSA